MVQPDRVLHRHTSKGLTGCRDGGIGQCRCYYNADMEKNGDNTSGATDRPAWLEGVPEEAHNESILPALAIIFGIMAMISALLVCAMKAAGVGSLMFGLAAVYCGRKVMKQAESGWEQGRGTATFGAVCGGTALFLFVIQMLLLFFEILFGPLFAAAMENVNNGGG